MSESTAQCICTVSSLQMVQGYDRDALTLCIHVTLRHRAHFKPSCGCARISTKLHKTQVQHYAINSDFQDFQ